MFVEVFVLLITTLIAYLLYSHKQLQKFFKDKDVKFKPGLPLFGNIFNNTFLRSHLVEDLNNIYEAFPDEKYVGYLEGVAPIFLIRDPELIKMITVKDFEHFMNHKDFFTEGVEPLFGASLFNMKGERWHDMRTTLSPAFTGSKMRRMVPFMKEISTNIIDYLRNNLDKDIDVDDLMRRYTNDVIASAGFGLQVNSVTDKDNEFYVTGQNMFEFTILQRLYIFLMMLSPSLTEKLGIKIFPEKYINFFNDLVKDTMEYRENNNVERPDMIQLLMEASKGSLKVEKEDLENSTQADDTSTYKPHTALKQWSNNELASQVFIFFAAGFETSAAALVMSIHEITLNSEVQDKLYQEIKAFEEKNKDVSYENINSLKYLDCVLNETLRKWSPAIFMDRVCTKEYDLPPPRKGAKPVKLKPGDILYNMVNCIQMDAKYYPNPEKFDPDRFSDDKRRIQPFTYMPFGMGPRNCIGSRFAILEVKILLYYIILNFKLLKCEKTADPISLKPHSFNIKAKGGTWVRLELRQ